MKNNEHNNTELHKEIDKLNEDALKAANFDVHLAKELLDKANTLSKEISYKKGLARNLYIYGYYYLRTSKYDEAKNVTDEALSVYENIGDKSGVGHCYNNYGGVYLYKSDFKKSLEFYQKALSVSEELKDNRAESIAANNIGNIYLQLGESYKALEYYIKSLNIKIELKDENGIGNTHSNIGTVHIRLSNYNIAIENYKKALDLSERTKDKYVEGNVLMNLGVAHSKMDEHEKALEYYKRCLKIRQEMEDKHGMALVLNNIGVSLYATKGLTESMKYLRKCLKIQKELGYNFGISETLSEIAEFCFKSEKYDDALDYLDKSKKIADEFDFKTQQEICYLFLSKVYFKTGEFEKAYNFLSEHLKIKEELLIDNSDARIKNLQIVYETENERTLSEFYRQKSIELTKLNDRLEDINNQKNEFLGIASHDLRDPISSIHAIAEILREENIKLNESEIVEYSDGIIKLSEKLLGLLKNLLNVNRIESGSYNYTFNTVNLNIIAEEIVRQYKGSAEEKNIEVLLERSAKAANIKADEYSIEQILSNLISNGIKFTYPGKKVYVRITENDKKIKLQIEDEGQGVKPTELNKLFEKFAKISSKPTGGELSTGLGLSIVKKLTEIMKGTIAVESEPGKGTKFTLEFNKA
ncbi:MAG: tetratricopeptide repeat-containing sensor histidine kinase [Bacteroidetes bacterium]|nr:tetratricopeptide repeat-containing sensor histidine kinase [Bacteroidota bacterium]